MDCGDVSLLAAWMQDRNEQWEDDARTARICSVVATCLCQKEFSPDRFMPALKGPEETAEEKGRRIERTLLAWVGRVGGGGPRKRQKKKKR